MQELINKFRTYFGPLGRDALFIFVGWRVNDVANLFYTLYLGRTLDSLSFGALAPIFALTSFAVLPVAIIFQIAIKFISRLLAVGNKAAYRALLCDLFLITLTGSVILVCVFFMLKGTILERLRLNGQYYIFMIIILAIIGWWHSFYMAVYQGLRKYKEIALYLLLVSIFTIGGTYVCVAELKLNLYGALIGKILSGLVLFAYLLIIIRIILSGDRLRDNEESVLMRKMFFPTFVYLGCINALYFAPALFIRNFAVADSGGFGAVMSFGMLSAYFINPIVVAIFPLASAEHAVGNEIRLFYRRAVIIGAVITSGFVAAFFLFGEMIFQYWNKKSFLPYSNSLWTYSLAMGINGIIQIIASVEIARHRYKFLVCLFVPLLIMLSVLYYWRTILTCHLVVIIVAMVHIVILLWLVLECYLSGKNKSGIGNPKTVSK